MSTILPDNAAKFPACGTFGFVAEPNFLVKIVPREGGYERRQRVWSTSLTKFSAVPTGDQRQDEIEAVADFWEAVGGMSNAFRFSNEMNYQSCSVSATPQATDQPLISSGDSPASYRLIKQYQAGPYTTLRYIQRPIGSTILIANEEGTAQTDFTVDEATGLVTIGGGFSGVPTSWGGEFDYWCRFDAQLNPTVSNYRIWSVTVQLAELREPLA